MGCVIPAKAGSRRQESEQTIGLADGPEGELKDATRNPVKYIFQKIFLLDPRLHGDDFVAVALSAPK